MPNQDLSFESIQDMTFNDYKKLFKKPLSWKASKVRGVAFLKDYDGFKPKKKIIALPIYKPMTPTKMFKQLQEAGLPTNKMSVCAAQVGTNDDGGLHFDLAPEKGSVAAAFVEQHGAKLFGQLLKATLAMGTSEETSDTTLEEETPQDNNPDGPTPQEDTSEGTNTSDESSSPKEMAQKLVADLKVVFGKLSSLKGEVVNRVKANSATDEDRQLLTETKTLIEDLLQYFNAAPTPVQQHPKLTKGVEQVKGQLPVVEKMIQKAGGSSESSTKTSEPSSTETSEQSSTETGEQSSKETTSDQTTKLEQHQKRLEDIRQRIEEIKAQLAA